MKYLDISNLSSIFNILNARYIYDSNLFNSRIPHQAPRHFVDVPQLNQFLIQTREVVSTEYQ